MKRLCKDCGKTPLHRDNTSGVCRGCKASARVHATMPDRKSQAAGEKAETPAPKKRAAPKPGDGRTAAAVERTAKEPKKPFVGLNLLVIEAVGKGAATVADIAGHFAKAPAFKASKQDPAVAARWHTWHLVKKGFLKRAHA